MKRILNFLALFLFYPMPAVSAESPVVVGGVCSQLGSSMMTSDRQDIVVCLENGSGKLFWKSTTSGSSTLPEEVLITSSGKWTVPEGVTRIRIAAYGAGGGGASYTDWDGSNGGNTIVAGNGINMIAYGGAGGRSKANLNGWAIPAPNSGGAGGYVFAGMGSPGGGGLTYHSPSSFMPCADGFHGGLVVKIVDVNPGDVLNMTVGKGGAGGAYAGPPYQGSAGADGFVTIIY